MKWPESLTLVRHGESEYNALRAVKEGSSLYQEFRQQYDTDWTSDRTRELAEEVRHIIHLEYGDHNTPLSERGILQARTTGERLREMIELPEVIFVSPYDRTHDTLNRMIEGWPELGEVKQYEEERIREQEHGLAILYNDWRLFQVFHPEQKMLHDLQGIYWYRFPNGENVPDVRERNRSWITTLIREFSERRVLAVTHHITLLATRANLERLSAQEYQHLDEHEKPVNCGVTVYKGIPDLGRDGRFQLSMYNQKLYND